MTMFKAWIQAAGPPPLSPSSWARPSPRLQSASSCSSSRTPPNARHATAAARAISRSRLAKGTSQQAGEKFAMASTVLRGSQTVRLLTVLFISMIVPSPAISAAIPAAAPAPALPAAIPAPAPAPKVLTLHGKVVATLRAAGHYGAISGLLDSLGDSAIIKPGITLFAPDDAAFTGLNMNSSLLLTTTLNYHVSTTVYTYQQLSNLPLNSTLQTAAPNVEIIVTSTGSAGLRLDGVQIADPDLYSDGQVAVHGVSSVFDTAKYNQGVVPPEAAPQPLPGTPPSAPPPGLITTPSGPKPLGNSTANGAHGTHTAITSASLGAVILASLVTSLLS